MDGGVRSRRVASFTLALLPFVLGSVRPTAEPSGVPRGAGEPASTAVSSASVGTLRRQLDHALPTTRWRSASWAVLVTSLDRGDTLFALNAHRPMAPASNVKLLTTATALHRLGPGFRYRTFLLSDAPVEQGVLQGDLVLYGTGDPTLTGPDVSSSSDPLRRMAHRLWEAGIEEIDGDVVGDGTYFHGPLQGPAWRPADLDEWFAPPIAALQYDANLATLRIRPGTRVGAPVRVETVPEGAPLDLHLQALTVNRRTTHQVWALRGAPDGPVSITGQMRSRDPSISRRMPVRDPALYAAGQMRRALEKEGIRVRGAVRTVHRREDSVLPGRDVWAPAFSDAPRSPRILAEHRSPPLVELLWRVNRKSDNFYAESIAHTLGRVVSGDGSFEGGVRVVKRFLVDDVGVPPDEVAPVDGSGLSPTNRVSPYAFVHLLDHMAHTPQWSSFWTTLPQAGNWRQLRRMYRSPAAGNLRAKTGTLRTVSALSGVVTAENGERLVFSIVSNDVPSTSLAKGVEDRIGIELASFSRPFEGRAPSAELDATADRGDAEE